MRHYVVDHDLHGLKMFGIITFPLFHTESKKFLSKNSCV